MKSFLPVLLLIGAAAACGDDAWRCVSLEAGTADDDQATRECATEWGNPNECWCYGAAEQYADFEGDQLWKLDGFRDCCSKKDINGRRFAAKNW